MPSESTSAFASSASIRLEYGPAGLELAPMPRLSNLSTRYPAARKSSTWNTQVSRSSARPLMRTIVSAPSPSSL